MDRIEKTFELAVPAGTAYSRWLHFDRAKGWSGKITEDVPGQLLAWKSDADTGRVRFEPLAAERTRTGGTPGPGGGKPGTT